VSITQVHETMKETPGRQKAPDVHVSVLPFSSEFAKRGPLTQFTH
jgi:hypothetical protein